MTNLFEDPEVTGKSGKSLPQGLNRVGGEILPCDLPSDHPDFDPFDWGDRPPTPISAVPDASFAKASDLLEFYMGFTSEAAMKAANKLPKKSEDYGRAIRHLGQMYPGYRWRRMEWYVQAGPALVKRDFLGFGDILGLRRRDTPGEGPAQIAAQITTLGQIMPHVAKFTSEAHSGGDEVPIEEFLRDFIAGGNLCLILGYYRAMVPKAGGVGTKVSDWQFKPYWVTQAELDDAVSRKRSPRGAAVRAERKAAKGRR